MPDNIVSRPYHPKMACEACCFGRGEHAEWCKRAVKVKATTFYAKDTMEPLVTFYDPRLFSEEDFMRGVTLHCSPERLAEILKCPPVTIPARQADAVLDELPTDNS